MPTQADIQAAIDRFESGYYNSDPYDAAANPGGLAADGHDINLPALLVDAGRAADVFALLSVTSQTQLTIGLSQKTLILDHARGFLPGASVVVAADAGNWMFGRVDAYDGGGPSLTFTPTVKAGTGTFSAWSVQAAGARGPQGPTTAWTPADLGQVSGTVDLDLATHNLFFAEPTGTYTLNFLNVGTVAGGALRGCMLLLTGGADHSITLPTVEGGTGTFQWTGGTQPDLSTGATVDWLVFNPLGNDKIQGSLLWNDV